MEYANKLAVFCAAMLAAAVSMVWVIRGFAENSKYHKEMTVITSISEFSEENSNHYRGGLPTSEGEGVKIPMAYVTCEAPQRLPEKFRITEDEKDKYSVGDELPYYGVDGTTSFLPADMAIYRMVRNLFAPVLIFIISAVVLAAAKKKIPKIKDNVYLCPKAFVFSVILTVLCVGCTVYAVLYNNSGIFGGLAEAFAQLGSIALSVIALIAEIIVWAVAVKRLKKYYREQK